MSDNTQNSTASPQGKWYAQLRGKIIELAKESGIAMMTGSVALFQSFLSLFFTGVGATDSLGISFDRLFVLFVCAYTALPLLLVAHVAAAKESYKWPRILANVCLVLLSAIVAELVAVGVVPGAAKWPVGSIVVAIGSALVSWSQYSALSNDRNEKSQRAGVVAGSIKRGRLSLPLSRSQLVVLFGALSVAGASAVGWTLDNATAYTLFHPCSTRENALSALCAYEQVSDSLAHGVVTHRAQRDFMNGARYDSLFRQATKIGFMDDEGPRKALAFARRLGNRSRAATRCDSIRLASVDADLQSIMEIRAPVAPDKEKEKAGQAKAKADTNAERRAHADSALKQCALTMQRADTVVIFAGAVQDQSKRHLSGWVKDSWAKQINLTRRFMVLAFFLAGVVLAVWVGGTTICTTQRVERQISTLIAILVFAVPLLSAVQSQDMPISQPSKLFQFPQWSLVNAASAPEPGRPAESRPGTDKGDAANGDSMLKRLDSLTATMQDGFKGLQARFN